MEESVYALYKEDCYWVVRLKMKLENLGYAEISHTICQKNLLCSLINTELSVYDFLYCRLCFMVELC